LYDSVWPPLTRKSRDDAKDEKKDVKIVGFHRGDVLEPARSLAK
jgi:hypothetical protein